MSQNTIKKLTPANSAIAAPITNAFRLLLPPWRLGINVKRANEPAIDGLSAGAIGAEWGFALIVIIGVVIELWSPRLGDFMVAGGVAGELLASMIAHLCQGELSRRSKMELGQANERAANADLARADLEKKLLPRMLNQDQWDIIQGLRGKFPIIAIAFETDAETRWFAGQIRDAFFSAGIPVAVYPRAAEVHSFGTFIFEPKGFDGAVSRTVEPLVEIFKRADVIGPLAVITEVPTDIIIAIVCERDEMRAPLDTPMIIIGGRFVLPPPHLEGVGKAAKAAIDAAKTNP